MCVCVCVCLCLCIGAVETEKYQQNAAHCRSCCCCLNYPMGYNDNNIIIILLIFPLCALSLSPSLIFYLSPSIYLSHPILLYRFYYYHTRVYADTNGSVHFPTLTLLNRIFAVLAIYCFKFEHISLIWLYNLRAIAFVFIVEHNCLCAVLRCSW